MQKMERASLQVDHVCHCIHIKGNTDSILLTKKEISLFSRMEASCFHSNETGSDSSKENCDEDEVVLHELRITTDSLSAVAGTKNSITPSS